jgi:N-sulfoglucosamine sulfohydrolase
MAAGGMRFDQAFLMTSSCSPSRSSIITGKYPHQTDAEQLHWLLPGYNVTFVEKLKAAGYWTAQAGKWHLGPEVKDRFDLVRAGGSEEDRELRPRDGSGCEDWVQTLKDRPEDQPFFLWLAAVDPHRGYRTGIIDNPHQPEDAVVPPYMPDSREVREDFAMYYDEIHRMDSYIGNVMDELEAQGVAEETLIVFISDNGRPFPRDKTTLYDGGIKTPWIMYWPETIPAGSIYDHLVSAVDIAPTFLELAQVDIHQDMMGISLVSLINDQDTVIREMIYAEDHWHDFDDYTRAVRTKQFKYIRNFYPELPNTPPADALRSPTFAVMREMRDDGTLEPQQRVIFNIPRPEEELYDVVNDPYELNNLATNSDYQDELSELQKMMEEMRNMTQDSLPPVRTPDEFDRETGEKLPNQQTPRPPKSERYQIK